MFNRYKNYKSKTLQTCIALFFFFNFLITLAQDQSFELSAVPSNWNVSKGNLSISTDHYKLGSKALKWEWSSNDELVVSDLQANGLNPNEVQGFFKNMFRMWVYNTVAAADKNLTITFYDKSNVAQFNYPFYLNFKGWRAASASYRNEMLGPKNSDDINTLKIKAPNTGSGVIYFDFIDYTMDRNTERSADYQLPFINKINHKHWVDVLYFESLPKAFANSSPTTKEIIDLNIVLEKYNKLILGRTPGSNAVSNAVKAYEELDISFVDGNVVGKPLYGTDFEKSKNINAIDSFIYVLAKDYKHRNKSSSLTFVLNTIKYMLDQGYAYGSLMETVHHIGYGFRNVSRAVHLMKDELVTEGIWDEARKMVEWYAAVDIIWHPTAHDSNMDDALTRAVSILGACLYKSSDAEKVQYLKGFKAYAEQWLTPNSKALPNGVRVDFTGFHHHTYYPQYCFGAYKSLSQTVNLIAGDTYGINSSKQDVFKKLLLVARINMSGSAFPNSLSGRSPFKNISITNAYKELGLADPIDTQLLKVYNKITGGDAQTRSYGEEEFPTGFWQINYANLGTYRQANWSASMKGFSKHFWGTEIYSSNNRYGRYQSYGSLEILYPGGRGNSGVNIKGWNWNIVPGTTTIHLPFSSLKASKSRQDEKTDTNFAGSLRFGSKENYYIDKNIEGTCGVFAMDFTQNSITSTHNPSFTFKKSVFCFDGKLICLGSNINNNDPVNITATNLFQNTLETESTKVVLNNEDIIGFPYSNNINATENQWLIDAYSTGYYLVKGTSFVIERKNQSSPNENGKGGSTTGDFVTAYIDHGTKPENENYEFVVIPGADKSEMISFASDMSSTSNAFYKVVQKDEVAHVVQHNDMTGYVFFSAGETNSDALTVKSSNAPILIMTKEKGDDLDITLVDPGLNIQTDTRESEEKAVTIKLNGSWELEEDSQEIDVVFGEEITTCFTLKVKNGLPIDLKVKKIEDLLSVVVINDSNKKILVYPNPANNILNIMPLDKTIKIDSIGITDSAGKMIYNQKNTSPINIVNYESGVYFIKLFDKNKVFVKKIIVSH